MIEEISPRQRDRRDRHNGVNGYEKRLSCRLSGRYLRHVGPPVALGADPGAALFAPVIPSARRLLSPAALLRAGGTCCAAGSGDSSPEASCCHSHAALQG